MKIILTKIEKPEFVTVLHLSGDLDGSSYQNLIAEANKVYADGTRDLVLDLSRLVFISSAGLAALHIVALLFRGEWDASQVEGWAAFHSIDRDRGKGTQEHVKLLSPSGSVRQVLQMTGFDALFETYTDLQQALASFRQVAPAMETDRH